jgi:16S rRNA (cytosine967-C5)-methyltransferase
VRSVRRRHGKLAGFANAVLRRLSPEDLSRDLPGDPTLRLAVVRSLPDALARRWTEQLGLEEADALAAATNERPPLTARINPLRPGDLRPSCRWAPDAAVIEGLDAPFASPSYRAGQWTAQDEASQLVGVALAPAPGEGILDACCGVGGKATHLAALMGDEGQVLCLDRSPRKLGLLAAHCRRLGVSSCRPVAADLTGALPLPRAATFHRVLLDAPCSGLGVLRRHPERKWRPPAADLVQLQRRLLEALVPLVRPGGTLVYAVCTTTDEEGPAQAEWLRSRFPGLRLDPPADMAGLTDEGVVRLWPHRHGTDGFCIVRLRRSG